MQCTVHKLSHIIYRHIHVCMLPRCDCNIHSKNFYLKKEAYIEHRHCVHHHDDYIYTHTACPSQPTLPSQPHKYTHMRGWSHEGQMANMRANMKLNHVLLYIHNTNNASCNDISQDYRNNKGDVTK